MLFPDLKTPLLWALGLGLVAALATAGIERTRAAGARAEAASSTEQTWRARVDGVIQDGQKQLAAARDDAATAARGLQNQLAAYRVAVHASQRPPLSAEARQPPTPSICSPTCSAGLTRERENWRESLMNAAPPARPASAGLLPLSPDN